MAAEPDQFTYKFKQKVERLERDGEHARGVSENYSRDGLLLVSSRRTLTDWIRSMSEYASSEAYLAEVRKKPAFDRAELLKEHRRVQKLHQLEFGLDRELMIDSDALNETPGSAGMPLPFHCLGLPTFIPSIPKEKPEKDRKWLGVAEVKYGFGEFKVNWKARIAAMTLQGLKIEVELDPKESWAAGLNVLLIMKPAGAWTILQHPLDMLPITSEGKFLLSIRTEWKDGGNVKSFEVGRCACEFLYQRIPVNFDDDKIYPAAWEHMLMHPEKFPPLP